MGSCMTVTFPAESKNQSKIDARIRHHIANGGKTATLKSGSKIASKVPNYNLPDTVDPLDKVVSGELVEEISSSFEGMKTLSFRTTELSLSINSREPVFPVYKTTLSLESSEDLPYPLSSTANSSRRPSTSDGTESRKGHEINLCMAPTPEPEMYPDPEIED